MLIVFSHFFISLSLYFFISVLHFYNNNNTDRLSSVLSGRQLGGGFMKLCQLRLKLLSSLLFFTQLWTRLLQLMTAFCCITPTTLTPAHLWLVHHSHLLVGPSLTAAHLWLVHHSHLHTCWWVHHSQLHTCDWSITHTCKHLLMVAWLIQAFISQLMQRGHISDVLTSC